MKNLSIQELADKMGGKYWEKYGKKRVYLEKGFNTKKMSTNTYIEEVNGQYVVKCFIECENQPYEFIKSQQEIVIQGVEEDLEIALATDVYLIKDQSTGLFVNSSPDTFDKLDICTEVFYSEEKADTFLEDEVKDWNANSGKDLIVVKMDKSEFEIAIQ
ncbi:MAG: hypothetical protein CL843_09260 [Crocinitomicaceae bacterium]|nr:hypothetical protein [Crocinitomicaceae bacterium]|tara:strand:- start:9209 stop:9685 length:477 start_codon:yes stop_codon:yes gene_type:complete